MLFWKINQKQYASIAKTVKKYTSYMSKINKCDPSVHNEQIISNTKHNTRYTFLKKVIYLFVTKIE